MNQLAILETSRKKAPTFIHEKYVGALSKFNLAIVEINTVARKESTQQK